MNENRPGDRSVKVLLERSRSRHSTNSPSWQTETCVDK